MRVTHGFEALPAGLRSAVTVGSYDGVHEGHRALLRQTVAEARRTGTESVVLTFEPHPRLFFEEQTPQPEERRLRLLTTLEEKIRLLGETGVDRLLVVRFDRDFSRLLPDEFVRLLHDRLGAERLVVGYDHRFGRNRSGDRNELQRAAAGCGMRVVELSEQAVGGSEHVSSTVVRDAVARGEMARAARLLGHPYLLAAEGDGTGRLRLAEPRKLLPPAGSYAVAACASGGAERVRRAELRIEPDALWLPGACGNIWIAFEP